MAASNNQLDHHNTYQREPHWFQAQTLDLLGAPASLKPWLLDQDSLTQRLINIRQGQFSVKVFNECYRRPMINEAQRLSIAPRLLARVREVHLYCGDTPLVFARTVIPIHTLQGKLSKLTHLGQKPLGAVLFADKTMERSAIEVCKIRTSQTIYKSAMMPLDKYLPASHCIWGRRSVFNIQGQSLLVSEIFLTSMENIPLPGKRK